MTTSDSAPRSRARKVMKWALATAAILAAGLPVEAADLPPAAKGPPSFALATGPTFSFTGYGWASALHGRASTLPPLPAAKVDLSFGDILKDLNGGVMGVAEMRIGNWGFIVDAMLTQVTSDGTLPGPYFSNVKLRSQTLTLRASVLYRLYSDTTFDVDLGAGLRFWNLDSRLKIGPGALNLAIVHSEAGNWLDPVVAARLITRLGGPWSLTLIGDVGGFDAGSRLTWQALGTVNYRWSENWMLHAGYRPCMSTTAAAASSTIRPCTARSWPRLLRQIRSTTTSTPSEPSVPSPGEHRHDKLLLLHQQTGPSRIAREHRRGRFARLDRKPFGRPGG